MTSDFVKESMSKDERIINCEVYSAVIHSKTIKYTDSLNLPVTVICNNPTRITHSHASGTFSHPVPLFDLGHWSERDHRKSPSVYITSHPRIFNRVALLPFIATAKDRPMPSAPTGRLAPVKV